MLALLHDVAVFDDQNNIRIANGGQTVGNDEARSTFHQIEHRILNENFRPCVDRTSSLIQNQYLGVGQERAGDG